MAVACLSACSDPGADRIPVASSAIDAAAVIARPTVLQIVALETRSLQAQVNDRAGMPIALAPIDFRSEDEAIVVVDAIGRVRSVGPAGATAVLIYSHSTVTRVPVTVRPGAAVALARTGSGLLQGVAGEKFEYGVTVRATDLAGNGVPELALTLRAEPHTGDPAPARTDVRGEASWNPALPVAPGEVEWVVESELQSVPALRMPVRVLAPTP